MAISCRCGSFNGHSGGLPCRVDAWSAVEWRFRVDAAALTGISARFLAALTPGVPWNEAAEKVPLNYRITCILCLANIIATC